MKIILFLFLFLNTILAKEIYIKKPSVLIVKYRNDNKYPVSIAINNIKFRESSLLPYYNGIFSIGINSGIYNITSQIDNYKIKIEDGKIIKTNDKLNNKLIKKNKWTILNKIKYFNEKIHNIKISSMVNFIKYNSKNGSYLINIVIDNKIIYSHKSNESVFHYLSNKIKMNKGSHEIFLKVLGLENYWCSCPTIKDGFNYGRQLNAWILNDKKNQTKQKIKTIKIVKIENNFKNTYNINIIEEKYYDYYDRRNNNINYKLLTPFQI